MSSKAFFSAVGVDPAENEPSEVERNTGGLAAGKRANFSGRGPRTWGQGCRFPLDSQTTSEALGTAGSAGCSAGPALASRP